MTVALILTGVVLGLLLWRYRNRAISPPGEIKVYRDDTFVQHYYLPQFGQDAISLGQNGDIGLADETLPSLVAQIRGQRRTEGGVEAVLDRLNPDNSEEVVDTRPLRDRGAPSGVNIVRYRRRGQSGVEMPADDGANDVLFIGEDTPTPSLPPRRARRRPDDEDDVLYIGDE